MAANSYIVFCNAIDGVTKIRLSKYVTNFSSSSIVSACGSGIMKSANFTNRFANGNNTITFTILKIV